MIVTWKRKEGFGFRQSIGVCLSLAPDIGSKLFVGRDAEIEEMAKVLRPNQTSPEQRRLVLGGIGGIGKTQLAIAYAKRHYKDIESTFWLNATSEALLKDSFRRMAEVIFDVHEPEVLQSEQMPMQVRRWLSDKRNTQWLLIFDNYDEPKQFNIKTYYPVASHGAIIVTTRRPDLVAGEALRLQPLHQIEDSLAILRTRSQREYTTSGMLSIL